MLHRWRGAALALVGAVMLASAASAQRGGGGFGLMGGGANMLRMPEVQAELKLTDEQKSKVTAMLDQLGEERQGQFQQLRDLSQEERQKRLSEWRAREWNLLSAILNADQQKRYRQLQLQQQRLPALADKPVADELKLTAAQQEKVQALVREQNEALRAMFGGGGVDPAEARSKIEALRKETDQKLAAVLTDEQRNQWKEMLGAPFTFPPFRPRQ